MKTIRLELNNWGVRVYLTFPRRNKFFYVELDPKEVEFNVELREENEIRILKLIRDYIGPEKGWQRLIDWAPVNKYADLPLEKINKIAFRSLKNLNKYLENK